MNADLQKKFARRISSLYSTMTTRYAKDQYALLKKARVPVTRMGAQPLPFTRTEFFDWITARFPELVGKCAYCTRPLDYTEFHLDHIVPLARHGSWNLDNLGECCEDCNRIKGKLTGMEFRAFRAGMDTFPEVARRDVYGRLKTGAMAGRLRYFGGAAGQGKTINPQPQEDF